MSPLKTLLLALTLVLSACGGSSSSSTTQGSDSTSSSNSSSAASTTCVSQWSASCNFSSLDPLQTAQGWWSGKRTLSNGESQSAYALVSNSNVIQIYLGDQLNAGQLKGTLSLSGSELSGLSLVGTDQSALASSFTNLSITSGSGGAVSGAHLSIQVTGYLPDPSSASSPPLSMQLNLDFNSLGSNLLSSLTGQYSDASGNVLSISPSGAVAMSYVASVYQIDQGVFSFITCKDNYLANPLTLLSTLNLSSSVANNCGVTNTISLYLMPSNTNPKIAVLGLGKNYLFQ